LKNISLGVKQHSPVSIQLLSLFISVYVLNVVSLMLVSAFPMHKIILSNSSSFAILW